MLMLPTTVYDIKKRVESQEKCLQKDIFSHVTASDKHHSTISPHVELFLYISVDPNYS